MVAESLEVKRNFAGQNGSLEEFLKKYIEPVIGETKDQSLTEEKRYFTLPESDMSTFEQRRKNGQLTIIDFDDKRSLGILYVDSLINHDKIEKEKLQYSAPEDAFIPVFIREQIDNIPRLNELLPKKENIEVTKDNTVCATLLCSGNMISYFAEQKKLEDPDLVPYFIFHIKQDVHKAYCPPKRKHEPKHELEHERKSKFHKGVSVISRRINRIRGKYDGYVLPDPSEKDATHQSFKYLTDELSDPSVDEDSTLDSATPAVKSMKPKEKPLQAESENKHSKRKALRQDRQRDGGSSLNI